ncbi:MAG: hypothetical protein LBD44_02580 [Spirochaetaceae bacterium]|nr:hypothetical protein [Spirochaetaceae bacterium]
MAFSGCFFGIVAGIYFLYNKFLLSYETDEKEPVDEGRVGQNIDYSLGDDNDWLNNFDNIEDGRMPEDISKINGGDVEKSQDIQSDVEEQPSEADVLTGEEKTTALKETPEVLAQSNDNGYSVGGDSLLPQKKAGAFSQDGYDMDMSVFVAGASGTEDDSYPQRGATSSSPGPIMNEGTVDMSVERRTGKPDLGFDVDGKKMAGAIQSLLKKDLG